jgi:phage-related protein
MARRRSSGEREALAPKADKPLAWLSGEIKTPPLSSEARQEAGVLLRRLQRGEALALPESRPMPSIGPRCHELRIDDVQQKKEWRVVYCVGRHAIAVLEVFQKTTRATPAHVIAVCRRRAAEFRKVDES